MNYVKEPDNYAEIPNIHSNYMDSKVAILPFPY